MAIIPEVLFLNALNGTLTDAAVASAGVDARVSLKSGAIVRSDPGDPNAADWLFSSSRTAAQNRVSIEAAITAAGGNGGGRVRLPPLAAAASVEPFTCPSNIVIDGAGQENTILSFNESAGTDFIEFSLASGSFKWGGVRNLSIMNGGSNLGGMGVSTPIDAGAFSTATHWAFENLQFRTGGGFEKYLRIGDANQGIVRGIEWRGAYSAASTDSGQADTTAIELEAAAGNIGVAMDKLMIVGIRTGLHLGDNCEGFSLTNTEIVGSWDGIVADPASSKPGGFIDNVHLNCNRRCIDVTRKRDLQIGAVQLYRSDTYFDHTGDWHGIRATDSDGVSIENALLRVVGAFPSAGTIYGIACHNADQTQIGLITVREPATIDKVLYVHDSTSGSMGAMIAYSNTTRLEYAGASSDWHFGKFIERGTTPTTPYTISATDKASVSFERNASSDENYTETSLSVALTDVLYPGVDALKRKYSVAVGAGVYVVNLDLDTATAVKGDVFEFRFTFLNSTNGTVNIRQGSGGSNLVVLNNSTGANWFPCLRFINNGAGWVLDYQFNSVA